MSIRKREWLTRKGEPRTAWVVDYFDGQRKRRLKTFSRKKDADAFAATTHVEIREGTHVADSASVTVEAAGKLWLGSAEAAGREEATLLQYRQHLRLHIVPFIGGLRLSQLNVPTVRAFEDRLRAEGRSPAMIRKIMVSLSSILSDALERGLTGRNPVREMRRHRNGQGQAESRQKRRLQVGVDIPAREDIRAIVEHAAGRWRPLLLTAIFTGLRASELRGLRWADVDLGKRELHVRQRADRYNQIGRPKSAAGERTVPLPPLVVNTLREWRLACPKGDLDLVFPNGKGKVENLGNIVKRGFMAAQIAAGVITAEGKAKYTGIHALRHWYASWCINARPEGLGLLPKVVQERLGHSSITMTMDRYGHLFPRGDDAKELAAAERALLA